MALFGVFFSGPGSALMMKPYLAVLNDVIVHEGEVGVGLGCIVALY